MEVWEFRAGEAAPEVNLFIALMSLILRLRWSSSSKIFEKKSKFFLLFKFVKTNRFGLNGFKDILPFQLCLFSPKMPFFGKNAISFKFFGAFGAEAGFFGRVGQAPLFGLRPQRPHSLESSLGIALHLFEISDLIEDKIGRFGDDGWVSPITLPIKCTTVGMGRDFGAIGVG